MSLHQGDTVAVLHFANSEPYAEFRSAGNDSSKCSARLTLCCQ